MYKVLGKMVIHSVDRNGQSWDHPRIYCLYDPDPVTFKEKYEGTLTTSFEASPEFYHSVQIGCSFDQPAFDKAQKLVYFIGLHAQDPSEQDKNLF